MERKSYKIFAKDKVLEFGKRTLVMGILNVTPDSFSDGGKYNRLEKALSHAREMAEAGADIIDIGGESTRPGAKPVSLEEELERVIPVVEKVCETVDLPISIDTYKAETARQAILAGAHIINDIWGCKADPRMAQTAAEFEVPIILMHNRKKAVYSDLIVEIISDLLESVALAEDAGVKNERIILDPGIGFGKTYEHNLMVMQKLDLIKSLGYPLLLGTSRKSLIAKTLNLPVHHRMEGTAATVALGISKGCDIVRVHDIEAMTRVVRMTDAMVRYPDYVLEGDQLG